MAEQTTNYGLVKPGPDEFYDVNVPNGNMDIIDTKLKELENKADITQIEQELSDLETEFTKHYGDKTAHITSQERSKWNGGFLAKSNNFISGQEVNFDLLEANKSYKVGEATGHNAPPTGYGILNYYFPEQGYGLQEFTTMVGDIKYTRRYDAGVSGGEWSAWKQATFSQSTITGWNNGAEVYLRFLPYCTQITNWNFATKNGMYMGLDAANAPNAQWHMGEVISHADNWLIQRVVRFGANSENGKKFERMRIDNVWEPWREVDQNVVYDKAHLGGGAYPDPNTFLDRAFITNHANAQSGGQTSMFWYIEQIFYSGSGASHSRSQFARSYAHQAGDMKVRHYYNGAWTPWSPSIQELFTSVSNGKTAVASAISDGGVYTSPIETFANMANNIRIMAGMGIRYARGFVNNVSTRMDIPAGTFGFTPKLIITRGSVLTANYLSIYSPPNTGLFGGGYGYAVQGALGRGGHTSSGEEEQRTAVIRNGGFVVQVAPSNHYPIPAIQMEWMAFG
ncbi:pyocin knob domain-containing protein [Solibacillus sp. FSL W8-0372]|uniref:pyocin knob domain-containing protein n=1 Tax=Solibacillus sp. FSL W8-0372 TaxID=2921713 RepID=UPI0030D35527